MFLSVHRPADFRLPYACVYVNTPCLAHTRTDIYVVLVMRMHRQAPDSTRCGSRPADFKLPATPRKHGCSQDEGLYIYKYVCV